MKDPIDVKTRPIIIIGQDHDYIIRSYDILFILC